MEFTEKNGVPRSTANHPKRRARRNEGNNISKIRKEGSVKSYRFDIGQRVLCRINNGWARGFVIKHDYSESRWPKNQTAPYQVRLDGGMTLDGHKMKYDKSLDGNLIYAPRDLDVCIRPYTKYKMNDDRTNDTHSHGHGGISCNHDHGHSHAHSHGGTPCNHDHGHSHSHQNHSDIKKKKSKPHSHSHSHGGAPCNHKHGTATGVEEEEPQYQCDYCKHFARKVYECGGCRKISYCGKKCQKHHWKNGHREECKLYRKNLSSSSSS